MPEERFGNSLDAYFSVAVEAGDGTGPYRRVTSKAGGRDCRYHLEKGYTAILEMGEGAVRLDMACGAASDGIVSGMMRKINRLLDTRAINQDEAGTLFAAMSQAQFLGVEALRRGTPLVGDPGPSEAELNRCLQTTAKFVEAAHACHRGDYATWRGGEAAR